MSEEQEKLFNKLFPESVDGKSMEPTITEEMIQQVLKKSRKEMMAVEHEICSGSVSRNGIFYR